MADTLTLDLGGGAAVAGVRDVTLALVGIRRSLARNAQGGSGMLITGAVLGGSLAVGTLLLGLTPFGDPGALVDLLATLTLGWLIGWLMGPIAFRGGGHGLRPEYFALLPIPPRRLAAGLLGASFAGIAPVITLVAFSVLLVAGARLSVPAFLVAIPATLLQVVVVMLLSKVSVAALTTVLNSRRGQDLGGLLMAVTIALSSGGWSLAVVVGTQLADGLAPALSMALRIAPSGWGPVAVAAADQSDWLLALAALFGLVVLSGLLLVAWAALLTHIMRKTGGRPRRAARSRAARSRAARSGTVGRRTAGWPLPSGGPTSAVVAKELRAWQRDPARSLGLIVALLISVLNLGVPAVAFGAPAWLPWVGLAAALFAGMSAVNLYGNEGTAFWLTRMMPGTERADVRGRQAAWLLVVAPVVGLPTIGLTVLSGQGWAWPWVLAALPAMLGGTAGLMVAMSVAMPVRLKEPRQRAGPFDTSDDPTASGAMIGQAYLMLLAVALTATPGCLLVLLGASPDRPTLQPAGVLVGVAVGVLLYWWGGRFAIRRLGDRGADVMDLLRLGPRPRRHRDAAGADHRGDPRPPHGRSVAVSVLWLVGILCVFPQGLVPIVFNLFGVDQQVKVWFVARYLPPSLQIPTAVGFMVLGVLAIWWAESTRRRGRPK